jgi:phosphonate transport system substrate-binding protein
MIIWCMLVGIVSSLVACDLHEPSLSIDLSRAANANDLARLPPDSDGTLYVGFDRRLEPKEDVKMYVPLLNYLERTTGYRFRLHPTPRDGNVVEDIGRGTIQFAIVGTLSYLQAHRRYGAQPLVRGLNAEGQGVYRAAIITRPTSPIQSLADLRGKTFAFGASNSTQGHLIPRILLEQAGIRLGDLAAYEYTGSHTEVANAVMSGRFDAGGMQDTLAQSLATRGLVRILALSPDYPSSGMVVAPGVDPTLVDAVRRALLDFEPLGKDAAGLYHWERTEMPRGFIGAQDSDYIGLQIWAERFGLLK